MEVEESASLPPAVLKIEKTAYEVLEESRTSMEEIVAKMLFIKKEGRPKSELRELITQMSLHLVTLRQANRSILLEEDRVKAETERAKAPVDFTTLQLHNLMYEKNHYVKAIKACKDFKSKHPDIELVPEEEFFSSAPEDIKQKTMSNESTHDLMLKRLHFELFQQRKELCKLHEKLEQHKKGLLETIATRKKFLSSLPSHLKSLKKASLPVQQQLGVLHTKKLKQHNSAELLPPPLYVIYSQFLAQKDAFGEHIDLEILGSMKDAQSFAQQQANKDTGISTNTEVNRLEDDAPDEEDDGQRRRKRPKKVPGKENLGQAGIYQSHPLKVILHIYDDEDSNPKPAKLVTLRFEYLLKLNVVCVGLEGSHEGPESNILCNLFPDDTGTELPHQSSKLSAGDAVAFDEKRTSRPFKWAQHLAGIDFLPEVSPLLTANETQSNAAVKSAAVTSGLSLYRQQNRVQTVVQRIRSREKAQLALAEQLDSLMKLKWPSLTYDDVPWALHTRSCDLQSWSPVGPSFNQASSLSVVATEQLADPLDVDVDGRCDRSKEEVENAREDGELPAIVQVSTLINDDAKLTPSKGSNLEHSRSLALISKSMVPPLKMGKSQSFRRHEDDMELILDSESDLDESTHMEPEMDKSASIGSCELVDKSWEDYGVREFLLVLSRRMDKDERTVNLEAKIKISMEYPLRPPLFTLSLHTIFPGGNSSERDSAEWYNELRAMEAEVNLHILKILPWDYENYILSHQVCFLAMLFDFYLQEASPSSEMRKSTSVVDVGLCKPASGSILSRSFRGRDRRKMISWKDIECTPGYPY
ncbi:THO complex [Macleaya cordata]|uniref:THO complex n=1 Tax=Macleaya cordata TaxID=56857 RepID=A0A200QZD4_MACCD|nr:THO complex [Macleaya cordata]